MPEETKAVSVEDHRKTNERSDNTAPSNDDPRGAEDAILAPQSQQISMKIERLRRSRLLSMIELASRERIPFTRIWQRLDQRPRRGTPKLTHEFGTPRANRHSEITAVVGEIQERRRRREFLSLKEHGRAGRQQPQRCDRAIQAGTRLLMHARTLARRRVGHLIVVVEECHEPLWRETDGRRAAAPALP